MCGQQRPALQQVATDSGPLNPPKGRVTGLRQRSFCAFRWVVHTVGGRESSNKANSERRVTRTALCLFFSTLPLQRLPPQSSMAPLPHVSPVPLLLAIACAARAVSGFLPPPPLSLSSAPPPPAFTNFGRNNFVAAHHATSARPGPFVWPLRTHLLRYLLAPSRLNPLLT